MPRYDFPVDRRAAARQARVHCAVRRRVASHRLRFGRCVAVRLGAPVVQHRGDYLRFVQCCSARAAAGRADPAAETVDEMQRNKSATPVSTLQSGVPERSNDANLFPGMVQKWASFLINTEPDGRRQCRQASPGGARQHLFLDRPAATSPACCDAGPAFADAARSSCFRPSSGRLHRVSLRSETTRATSGRWSKTPVQPNSDTSTQYPTRRCSLQRRPRHYECNTPICSRCTAAAANGRD